VLQTKVDAECDKLATDSTCDGRRFRVIASYLSKFANYNQPHLHLAIPLGVTRLSFVEIFGVRKLDSLGYRVALFA